MGHANNIITAPVDFVGDLAYLFGVDSGDIKYIISHAYINKWAKFKPIEFNNPGKLTAVQRSLAHHGFTVSPNSAGTVFEYSLHDLFSRYALNNGEYAYQKPTTWYRSLDFIPPEITGNGYNHSAPAPFVYNNPSGGSGYVTNPVVNITLDSSAAAELSIKDIIESNSYQSDMTKMNMCLAMKYTKNNQEVYKLFSLKTTDGMETPRTLATFVNGERLYAQAQLDGFRTYQFLWCATEVDPENIDEPGACVYFPLGGFTYEYTAQVYTQYYTFSWYNGTPSAASVPAYDKQGNYVPCAAVNFQNFAQVTMATVAPEQRTATIKCTASLYLKNGQVIPCEPFEISAQHEVSCNTTNTQVVDTSLVGKVLLSASGEHYAVSDVDYIKLYTDVEIDSGGYIVINLINSAGQQTDDLYY